MSNTKKKAQMGPRAAKQARFAKEKTSARRGASPPLIIGVVVVLAIVAGTAWVLLRTSQDDELRQASVSAAGPAPVSAAAAPQPQAVSVTAATYGHDPYPLAVAEGGVVRLPLATFDDYKAHYYTYMDEGRSIEFFVLKSRDGVVRAAFNACDVCFGAKRGYSQDGDVMVCNNCGSRFPADQINVLRGGCNPAPLDRAVDGDSLVIQAEDIVTGLGYF